MRAVGHRGCPEHGPENTVAAVRTAVPHVDWVEVDVRRCGSGEVVVHHDETLDRTTSLTGPVAEASLAELSRARVDGTDEPVPTLAAVLDAVPPAVTANVELKERGLAADVARAAGAAAAPVVVSSFDREALAEARDERGAAEHDEPAFALAPLFVDEWTDALAWADDVDASYLHAHWEAATAEQVSRAHAAGLEVNAWTPPDRAAVRACREAGVDGVIVDSWTFVGETEGEGEGGGEER
jgi:glycerophosphoryl diester phosphodiesterase